MTDCIAKDRTRRVRLFPLDACGRIKLTGSGAVLDFDGFETIGFTENITAGTRETITTTSGATCRDKLSCPTDQGQTLAFNECTESWALMAIMGYGTLQLSTGRTVADGATTAASTTVTSATGAFTSTDIGTAITGAGIPVGAKIVSITSATSVVISAPATATGTGISLTIGAGNVIGFNRNKVACDARIAVEILFDLDAACDAGGATQCVARLYPLIDRAVLSGTKTVNGKNVIRGTYSLNTELNPRVFENFATSTPTGELSYWAPWQADIAAGNAFYYDRLVNCPTLTSTPLCELRSLVTT